MDALELVGLTKKAEEYPWQLSGGMQQRVALARALADVPQFEQNGALLCHLLPPD